MKKHWWSYLPEVGGWARDADIRIDVKQREIKSLRKRIETLWEEMREIKTKAKIRANRNYTAEELEYAFNAEKENEINETTFPATGRSHHRL